MEIAELKIGNHVEGGIVVEELLVAPLLHQPVPGDHHVEMVFEQIAQAFPVLRENHDLAPAPNKGRVEGFRLLEAFAEIAVCRNDVTPPLGIQPHVEGLANLWRITPTCIEVAFG